MHVADFSGFCRRCGRPVPRYVGRRRNHTPTRHYCGVECRKVPIAERLAAKTDKSGDCWLWQGSTNYKGYGYINLGEKGAGLVSTHRLAWKLANGPVPDGLWVLHKCDVRNCVNPAHLFLGTPADNMHDMAAKGRKWSPRGELSHTAILTEENVIEIRVLANTRSASPKEMAARFGVADDTVRGIISRRTWKHVA